MIIKLNILSGNQYTVFNRKIIRRIDKKGSKEMAKKVIVAVTDAKEDLRHALLQIKKDTNLSLSLTM